MKSPCQHNAHGDFFMDMTPDTKTELLATANALADAARNIILPYFRTAIQADTKDTNTFDPVTIADREAEQAMRDILATRRPDDAILGEEFGTKPGSSGLTWVLDPIDGTRAFISGTTSWGVLIGLDDGTGPLFGLIDQPFLNERFIGGFGHATLTDNRGTRPLVTRAASLQTATLFSTFPEVGTQTERTAFNAVSAKARLTRFGLDCYAYALLAMGQIDLVIEAGLNPYDVQGPIAVVQGAGGIVTDWQGRPAHNGGRILAAGNAALHAEALEILRRY